MRSSLRCLVSLAIALLALTPDASSAQLGGLVRRARDVASQSDNPGGGGASGQPLDEPLVARLLAGLRAADPIMAKRDRVQAGRVAKADSLTAMREKNEAARSAYETSSATVRDCRDAVTHAREEARAERMEAEMQTKAADPVFAAKMQLVMMKYGKAMAEAQQKNDPVLLAKAQADMQRELMGDIAAVARQDTLAADTKCGTPVARPAALEEQDRLERRLQALDDQLRVLEAQAASDGASAARLDRVKYAELKERLHDIYGRVVSGDGPGRYGSGEYTVVQHHKAELDRLARAL